MKYELQINYLFKMLTVTVTLLLVIAGKFGVIAKWSNDKFLKREHSLVKPYQTSGIFIPNWDFIGSTMITNNYIRLTPDMQSKAGALWNRVPCFAQNWELQVEFKIQGKGKDLYGDGIAIWYAKEPLSPGPVFGSKDYFSGLGIFLDTYANQNTPHNHGHPYISAMVNNGTLHFDHDRDGTHTEIGGCEAKFRGVSHGTYILIRYEDETLSVLTDVEGKSDWTSCTVAKHIRLPTGYFFGLSAVTGELSDNHDILSIKLYELENEQKKDEDRTKILPSASYFAPPRDHVESPSPSQPPMSGTKLFLMIVCALLGACVCVVGGVMVIQTRQECSRKRLY